MESINIIKDSTELRKLIAENPELPIVVLCHGESCTEEYSYTYMSDVRSKVGEILDCETPYADYIFDDREDFIERISDSVSDEYGDLPDEDFDKVVEANAAAYEQYWRKAIIICAGN